MRLAERSQTSDDCDCELAYLGGEPCVGNDESYADDFDDETDDFGDDLFDDELDEYDELPIPDFDDEESYAELPSTETEDHGVIVDNGLEALPMPVMKFDSPDEETGQDHSGYERLPIPEML